VIVDVHVLVDVDGFLVAAYARAVPLSERSITTEAQGTQGIIRILIVHLYRVTSGKSRVLIHE
jgi:hypothetical protein